MMKTLIANLTNDNLNPFKLSFDEKEMPTLKDNECLVKILYVGINPSDALALEGYFDGALWPRIPGRDFSGTVVNGPSDLIGRTVWFTGGDKGIYQDGYLRQYIKVPAAQLALAPDCISPVQAAAQPLPFVTAYYSLVNQARLKAGEIIYVMGAMGAVGMAAMMIGRWLKANVVGLVRGQDVVEQEEALGFRAYDTDNIACINDIKKEIGQADIVLNSQGNLFFHEYLDVLNNGGRIVTIGAAPLKRVVELDLFKLYRKNQSLIGVNSVLLSDAENKSILDHLKIGFEQDILKPLNVKSDNIFPWHQADKSFKKLRDKSNKSRVILEVQHD